MPRKSASKRKADEAAKEAAAERNSRVPGAMFIEPAKAQKPAQAPEPQVSKALQPGATQPEAGKASSSLTIFDLPKRARNAFPRVLTIVPYALMLPTNKNFEESATTSSPVDFATDVPAVKLPSPILNGEHTNSDVKQAEHSKINSEVNDEFPTTNGVKSITNGVDALAINGSAQKTVTATPAPSTGQSVIFFDSGSHRTYGILSPYWLKSIASPNKSIIKKYLLEPFGLDGFGVPYYDTRHGNIFRGFEHAIIFATHVIEGTPAAQSIVTCGSRAKMLKTDREHRDVHKEKPYDDDDDEMYRDRTPEDNIFDPLDDKEQITQALRFALCCQFGDNTNEDPGSAGVILNFLDTVGDAELVYANPKDKVLGIGMDAQGERNREATLRFRNRWGQNLWGKALMEWRDLLKKIPRETLVAKIEQHEAKLAAAGGIDW